MNDAAVRSNKVFSDEIKEIHNNPFSNKMHYKDYIQEMESKFLKSKSKETLDSLRLKKQKKSCDSNKLLTSSEEPSHYSEFATKLDYLMEKVIDLAKSSGDFPGQNSEETRNVMGSKSPNGVKSKPPAQQIGSFSDNIISEKFTKTSDNRRFEDFRLTNKQYSNVSYFGIHDTHKLEDANPIGNVSHKNSSLMKPMIPPIMNDNIKYIRVSSKHLNKNECSVGSLEKDLEPTLCEKKASSISGLIRFFEDDSYKSGRLLSHATISESLTFNSYTKPINIKNEAEQETFRILISGHLTTRDTPVFIIHKNYIGSSSFIKDSFDFRARRKKENVDIVLTGKFFHDNILIENDKGNPFALDLKSHRILIDTKSTVTQDSFKYIFDLGLFDAILEGEFVANSETLQYIPLLSLEVKPSVKENYEKPTTIIETDEKHVIDSSRGKTKRPAAEEQDNMEMFNSTQDRKHVLCSSNTQVDVLKNMQQNKTNKMPKESKFTKLKDSIFSLFRSKGSNDSQITKSSQNTNEVRKVKCSRKIEEIKLEEDQKQRQIATLKIREVNSNNDSKKSHTEEKSIEKKPMKKKLIKHGMVAENPGISQMQGFFFQT